MKSHSENIEIKYSAKQMYDLVLDIEKYPEFVPWCSGCEILEKANQNKWLAQMDIGFGMFSESFKSYVNFQENTSQDNQEQKSIEVQLLEGPFKTLENTWKFVNTENGCLVDFNIKFAFKNLILEKLVGSLFDKSAQKMVSAFIERAEEIYDNK